MRSNPCTRWTKSILATILGAGIVVQMPSVANADRLQMFGDNLTSDLPYASPQQGVKPLAVQRIVGLDGAPMAGAGGAGVPPPGGGLPDIIIAPNRRGGSCGGAGGMFDDVAGIIGAAGGGSIGGVNLMTGVYSDSRTHIHLPQSGADWVISADHNSRQASTSQGFQGANRFQGSAIELQRDDGMVEDSMARLYLVAGAGAYQDFKRVPSSNVFNAVNGGFGGARLFADDDDPDTIEVYDIDGATYTFFGFDEDSGDAQGQLWKITAPGHSTDSVSYVGDSSDPANAITVGFENGAIYRAYDSADRRYTYDYDSGHLIQVLVETKSSGSWASPSGVVTVAQVDYTYYGNEDYGTTGDLKMVKVSLPLTDTGTMIVTKTYYRYYEGAYHPTTNPGHEGQIKYIYESEGLRQFDWTDSTFDEDFLTASENDLKPYASAFFKYEDDDAPDELKRVIEAWFNGSCGCGGGSGAGTYVFRYESLGYSDTPNAYDTEWCSRTIVKEPTKDDVSPNVNRWVTTYFDEVGQVLAQVITEEDPANDPARFWATVYDREWLAASALNGFVEFVHTPENITGYDHDDGSFTKSDSSGLVLQYSRFTSGDYQGLVKHIKYKNGKEAPEDEGTSPTTPYLQESIFYDRTTQTVGSGTTITLARTVVDGRTTYTTQTSTEDDGPGNAPPSGAFRTEWTYDFYDDMGEGAPLITEDVTTTYPAVDAGKNGSGSTTSTRQHFRKDARVSFTKAADGTITYYEYVNGLTTKVVQDADTTQDGGGGEQTDFSSPITIPSGYSTDSPSAAFHMRRVMTYDRGGRLEKTVTYKSKSATIEDESLSYVSTMKDARVVALHYPKFETSGTKYYGPIQMTVANHSGGVDVSAIIALDDNGGEYTTDNQSTHVDETSSDDPIVVVTAIGDLKRMNVQVHNKTGTRVDVSRAYFVTPGSGAGSEGSNYDSTFFGYDNSGRRWRVEDPTGTVRRTVYDKIGRVSEQWIGTNDNSSSFPGGDVAGSPDMVKIEALVYDAGAAKANGRLSTRTAFVQDDTTGQRATTYTYDLRGRMLLQTNPTAPHVFNKYDDAGRLIASGQFSSTGSITALSDDPTSETTNRLALSQTFYDEKGQVWKTQRHKVDDSDGTQSDNLQELTWYDAAGRVIKVDGGQLTKTFYDRLGRQTHQFIIASIDDSDYDDADDLTDEVVLQESQTTYDRDSGLVVMTAVIERLDADYGGPGNETTGKPDSNSDSDILLYTNTDIEGRIQITANWYDSLDRLQDTVSYGDYGGSAFDRDGRSVPTRSDTELRTSYAYNADGTTLSITDPKAIVTRFAYDDAGRQITVINNYVNGTPSGPTGADDVHTRYAYTDGLKTKMHVDFDGAGDEDSTDEVTTWTYGVTKGASAGDSKISAGHLLNKVIYPEQSGGQSEADKRVSYAYNAQGQTIWTKDQTGTIIENDFDTSGRQIHRRATTITGLDDVVKRISTTYDSLGRRSLVTQYDNATAGSGSVIDEVKFTYDDWGNIEKFEQDRDSAVGGGPNDYEVSYSYAKATDGRNTVRRASMTLPSGNVIDFNYSSTSGLHDADASRVTEVKDGAVVLARYRYNGVGSLIQTYYDEPDLFLRRNTASGIYGNLDRFNRVTSDTWQKDLSTDLPFYDTDIFYDRNSNIVHTEDQIYTPSISAGFDVAYTMDDLNRLTDADEGDWNGSSISSRSRRQLWTLDQVGNWTINRWSRNGDGDYIDSGEVDDSRSHNNPNELIDRDLDTDGDTAYDDTHYDLTYNKRGDMTDDGQHYKYVYDAFGRLRQVKKTASPYAVVAEYWYNPLGFRRAWQYDTDADNDVDGSDKTYNFAYDERWRIVATFRESDTSPKEEFVYHNAGTDGYGSSSYIDTVIARDQDANSGWTSAADGVLEQRTYYCQNWRGDVVARITSGGQMIERVKYSAYGVPYGIPRVDSDGNGTIDNDDLVNAILWWGSPASPQRASLDFTLDGNIDNDDYIQVILDWSVTLGWGNLSLGGAAGGNRKGYAGYEFEPALAYSMWHVRHRVLNSDLGRWTRRDPFAYSDAPNLYQYVRSTPLKARDPFGLVISDAACESALESCMLSDPAVVQLYESVSAACGDRFSFPTCEDCSHFGCGADGSTSCGKKPRLTVCTDGCGISTPADVCDTLRHELVHVYDICSGSVDCGGMLSPWGIPCHQRACTELRAYTIDRGCCPSSWPRLIGETFVDCIIRRADASLPWYCGGSKLWATDCIPHYSTVDYNSQNLEDLICGCNYVPDWPLQWPVADCAHASCSRSVR